MRCDFPKAIRRGVPHEEAFVFLAQRLEEATSPSSLDSYRAMTVNVPALLKEGIGQARAIHSSQAGVPPQSLVPILDELADRFSSNKVVSAIIPGDRLVVERLRSLQPIDQVAVLTQLGQELSGWAYATQVMKLLIDTIETNRKEDIYFLSSEMATTLINLDMSRRYIHEEITDFFWNSEELITKKEDLRRLFVRIFPHGHQFDICFKVSSQIDVLSSDKFPTLNILVYKDEPERFKGACEGLGVSANSRYVVVSGITALDRHSAIKKAKERVSLLKNLYRMYNHNNAFHYLLMLLLSSVV